MIVWKSEMNKNKSLDLVEALKTGNEKASVLLGLFSMGFLFLSIYLFSLQSGYYYISFPVFFILLAATLIYGRKAGGSNLHFARLFGLLFALQEVIAMAGWVWILHLYQDNPQGRYQTLVTISPFQLILFFLVVFLSTFIGLLISLVGLKQK